MPAPLRAFQSDLLSSLLPGLPTLRASVGWLCRVNWFSEQGRQPAGAIVSPPARHLDDTLAQHWESRLQGGNRFIFEQPEQTKPIGAALPAMLLLQIQQLGLHSPQSLWDSRYA